MKHFSNWNRIFKTNSLAIRCRITIKGNTLYINSKRREHRRKKEKKNCLQIVFVANLLTQNPEIRRSLFTSFYIHNFPLVFESGYDVTYGSSFLSPLCSSGDWNDFFLLQLHNEPHCFHISFVFFPPEISGNGCHFGVNLFQTINCGFELFETGVLCYRDYTVIHRRRQEERGRSLPLPGFCSLMS